MGVRVGALPLLPKHCYLGVWFPVSPRLPKDNVPNTCREWSERETSRVRVNARRRSSAFSGSSRSRTHSVPPVPPPDAEEGCDWAHLLPIRAGSILLPTIGSPGKGQSVVVGLLLRDLAPPRKPLLADARDRDCSLPAPATTLPARALSASPALPPWPPLCGVGRSWSSHSAPAASSPARGRIPRNRISQSRREGFPPPIQGQDSFPYLERQKLRVSPPYRIRSQRVPPPLLQGWQPSHLPAGHRPLVYVLLR